MPVSELDMAFLDEIRITFRGGGYSWEDIVTLVFFIISIIGLTFVLLVVNNLLLRYRLSKLPSGSILNPKFILSTLKQAQEQRSPFDLQFHADAEFGSSLTTRAEEINKNTVVLETTGNASSVLADWVGRQIKCFIRVEDQRRRPSYYAFTTKILSIRKPNPRTARIMVETPKQLEARQRRASIRIEPHPREILSMIVWPVVMTKNKKLESDTEQYGEPLLHMERDGVKSMSISDISAGGARLAVHRAETRGLSQQIQVGRRFIIMLDVKSASSKGKKRFWLLARVQNIFEESNSMVLGLRFSAQGTPKGADKKRLKWEKLGSEGSTELGDWVMQLHLEMFRGGGVAA